MKNWQTTVVGVFVALVGFVALSPEYFKDPVWLVPLAKYLTAGGFAAMGFVSKDRNVTGGTVAQDDKAGGLPAEGTKPSGSDAKLVSKEIK